MHFLTCYIEIKVHCRKYSSPSSLPLFSVHPIRRPYFPRLSRDINHALLRYVAQSLFEYTQASIIATQ